MTPDIGEIYKTRYGNLVCLGVSEENEDGNVDTLWEFGAIDGASWRYVVVAESDIEPVGKHSFAETELRYWFERDRAHVHLVSRRDGETLFEAWDDDVSGLVEAGYLLAGKRLHQSAYDYWLSA